MPRAATSPLQTGRGVVEISFFGGSGHCQVPPGIHINGSSGYSAVAGFANIT